MSLLTMLRGLAQAEVKYVVIGGVAGVAHGSVRITRDLDICIDLTSENRQRLAELLARWDAYPRGVEPGLPFIMDARTVRDLEVLTLRTREGAIDVLHEVLGVGDYAACARRSEAVEMEGLRFAALELPALIAAKRAAGRPRDLEHLRELEALLELTRRSRKK